MILHDKKIVSLNGHTSKPVMHIYTSSGRLLNQFQVRTHCAAFSLNNDAIKNQWDKESIVSMEWVNDEKLACVLEQGIVSIIELDGSSSHISLGEVQSNPL